MIQNHGVGRGEDGSQVKPSIGDHGQGHYLPWDTELTITMWSDKGKTHGKPKNQGKSEREKED